MKKILLIIFFLTNILYAKTIDENVSLFDGITRGETALVEYMLKKRANVNATNIDGMSPLHLVSDLKLAQLLIINGADVNAKNRIGSTPLHWAISRELFDIAKLLIEYGADIDAQDNNGNTPLHFSVLKDDRLTLLLIRSGANVNITNKMGTTPLLTALSHGNIKTSTYLTLAGAKNIKNIEALSPTTFTSIDQSFEIKQVLETEDMDPLIKAIFIENYNLARQLILDGVDLQSQDINGNTALHWAFNKKNRYLAKLLLQKGANYNTFNTKDQSPLDVLQLLDDKSFIKYIQTLLIDKTNFLKKNSSKK